MGGAKADGEKGGQHAAREYGGEFVVAGGDGAVIFEPVEGSLYFVAAFGFFFVVVGRGPPVGARRDDNFLACRRDQRADVGGDLKITDHGLMSGESFMAQIVGGAEADPVVAKSLDIGVRYPAATTPSSPHQPRAPNVLIYQDGIYVTGTGEISKRVGDDPFPAHAWIDYRYSARSELTPSRNSLARDPQDSPEMILLKARTHAFFRELRQARSLAPTEKIRKLVQLEKFFGVGNGTAVEKLPWNEYPVLVLHPSGDFRYVAAQDAFVNGIRTFPLALRTSDNAARALQALSNVTAAIARGYRGGPWLFEFTMHQRGEAVVQQSATML